MVKVPFMNEPVWKTRIRELLVRRALTMKAASLKADLSESYLRDVLERGREPGVEKLTALAKVFGVPAAHLLEEAAAAAVSVVACMGYIGAGAEIEPDYEQVPPEGLFQVELPFSVPPGLVCFEVRGDSMLPRYDEGDVILVYADQVRATDNYFGEEVAVRLSDGRRFLKRLMRGSKRNRFILESWNARPIQDVGVEWIGEIYLTIRAGQRRRIEVRAKQVSTRRRNAKAVETEGMEELPLGGGREAHD